MTNMSLTRRTIRSVAVFAAAALVLSSAACTTAGTPTVGAAQQTQAPSFLQSVDSIAALGDSMTAGVNACGEQAACLAASWSTGSDQQVNSIAQRIGQLSGTAPKVFNDARAGALASGLAKQVDSAIKQKPALVTILIGNNDICRNTTTAMTAPDEFSGQVSAAVQKLNAGLPDSWVFVASVPQLAQLYGLTKSIPAATAVYKKAKMCGAILAPGSTPAADDTRLADVSKRVDAYNGELKDLCAQAQRCVYDDGQIAAQTFTIEDVSTLDYFHPSVEGQKLLADAAWQALQAHDIPCPSGGTDPC
jgi:lysophospholipase L1-like esterase